MTSNNNKFESPGLAIQSVSDAVNTLHAQRNTSFTDYNNPSALASFTGIAQLRERAKWFKPTSTPLTGMAIPTNSGSVSDADGGWNNLSGTWYTSVANSAQDLFGAAINVSSPPIGASAGVYE
jgi:hypothetical protein